MTEGAGGIIYDRNWREIVSVNVDKLTTDEAKKIMQCVLKALNEEFKRD